MKTLLLSLSFFLTFTACGGKDADTGTADDEFTIDAQNNEDDAEDAQGEDAGNEGGNNVGSGEVMSASPGCDLTGALCYSFDGPIWPGQDTEYFCDQLSSQYEAQGAPAMAYTSNGCPAGALGECSGIPLAGDADGNPVSGSEVTVYYYMADSGGELAAECTSQGGTYTAL